MLYEGSGAELVSAIQETPRALVFVSVPWSAPERNARRVFTKAVEVLEQKHTALGIRYFRLEADEDDVSMNWLSSIGFLHFAVMGAGSLLWLENGRVIGDEVSVNLLNVLGVIAKTTLIWGRN